MELLFIKETFHSIISVIICILESFGVIVVFYGAVYSFYRFISTRSKGREILKTIIARSLEELYTIGAIILLRAALNYVIHWEIKQETLEKEIKM